MRAPAWNRRATERRLIPLSFTNVPAFVLSGGHSVRVGSRELRVDIAFGGVFYAIADTEAIGIPLTREVARVRRLGAEIRASINARRALSRIPSDDTLSGVAV